MGRKKVRLERGKKVRSLTYQELRDFWNALAPFIDSIYDNLDLDVYVGVLAVVNNTVGTFWECSDADGKESDKVEIWYDIKADDIYIHGINVSNVATRRLRDSFVRMINMLDKIDIPLSGILITHGITRYKRGSVYLDKKTENGYIAEVTTEASYTTHGIIK